MRRPSRRDIAHVGAVALISASIGVVIGLIESSAWTVVLLSSLFVACIPLVLRSLGRRLTVLEPLAIFLLCYIVLFIVRPAYALSSGGADAGFQEQSTTDTYTDALLVALVGLFAFSSAYIGAGKSHLRPPPQYVDDKKSRSVIVVLVSVSLAGFATFLATTGGLGTLGLLWEGRTAGVARLLEESSGYLYASPLAVSGIAIWLWALGLERKSLRLVATSVVLSAYALIMSLAGGDRSYILPQVAGYAISYYLVTGRRPRPRTIAVGAVIVLVVGITLPRVYRDASTDQDFAASLTQASDRDEIVDAFLLGEDTAMIDALALEIAKVPNIIPFQYGATYVGALARPIPRALWGEKPPSADALLNEVIFPRTYSRGIGLSFSIFGEPYLNGGILGVVSVLGLFGVLAGRFWSWAWIYRRNVHAASVAALCVPYVIVFFRGGFGVDYHRLLFALIPLLIVIRVNRVSSGRHVHTPGSATPR